MNETETWCLLVEGGWIAIVLPATDEVWESENYARMVAFAYFNTGVTLVHVDDLLTDECPRGELGRIELRLTAPHLRPRGLGAPVAESAE